MVFDVNTASVDAARQTIDGVAVRLKVARLNALGGARSQPTISDVAGSFLGDWSGFLYDLTQTADGVAARFQSTVGVYEDAERDASVQIAALVEQFGS